MSETVLDLTTTPNSALLTYRQLSDLTGFSLSTVKRWATQGKGPRLVRIEGQPRYFAGDVKEWLWRPITETSQDNQAKAIGEFVLRAMDDESEEPGLRLHASMIAMSAATAKGSTEGESLTHEQLRERINSLATNKLDSLITSKKGVH